MTFLHAGRYAAHSDCGRYAITWGDVAPPYHSSIRGQPREVFGGSLGSHPDKASAKAACEAHRAQQEALL